MTLSLILVGCSSQTGLVLTRTVPEDRRLLDQRIELRACSGGPLHPLSRPFPDFSELEDELLENCPGAVGMADVSIALVRASESASLHGPPPAVHCWVMEGYPVFPEHQERRCKVREAER